MNHLIYAGAIVLVIAASAARAQPIFKSTMPDGKVIYGQKPDPGAQRIDEIAPHRPRPAPRR